MGIYSRLLQSHPLLAKCITNGTVFGLGDVIAQSLADASDDVFSWRRVALTSFYVLRFKDQYCIAWAGYHKSIAEAKSDKALDNAIENAVTKAPSLWMDVSLSHIGTFDTFDMGLYSRLLQTHPLLTKSITTWIVVGAGDALAQTISSDDEISLRRVAAMSLHGLLIQGPALHVWFGFLERMFPGKSVQTVVSKIAAQQFLYAPWNISSYTAWAAYFQASNQPGVNAVDVAIESAVTKLPSIWMDGNYFWVPVNLFMFGFVPVQLRPVAQNGGSIVWTAYLSYRANQQVIVRAPLAAFEEI
ncbi:unnamed protein product [Aphanomyces euteiches]